MAEQHLPAFKQKLPCSVDSSEDSLTKHESLLNIPGRPTVQAASDSLVQQEQEWLKTASDVSSCPKMSERRGSAASKTYSIARERDRAIKLVQESSKAIGKVISRKSTTFTHEVACEIERTLYDLDYYTDAKGELKDDGIIAFHGYPSPGLLRAFTDSRVRRVDMILVCSVCATCVVAPLTFIFNSTWKDPSLVPGRRVTLVFDMISDVFYAFYLLWQLNVSILDRARHCEVVSRTEVIRRRIHSGFYWLQWLSVTPYFWIACGVNLQINCMKLIRLYHIFNLPDSLWEFKEGIINRVGRIIGLLLFVSHWSACLLVSIGGYREATEEHGFAYFETKLEGSTVPGSISLYIMAFVEAIYMLTGSMDNPLGDGLVREKQFGSLIIVAVCSPVGCVVMSLFIASICRENSLWGVLDMKHEENKAFMNRALQSLNIPHQLRQRVFKLHHFQRMGHDREAFEALFSRKNLSPALESALKIYIYHDNVMQSPYFCGKDTNYVLEVIRVLDDQVFLPGDFVTRRGEVGTLMYFIVRGEVSVLVPDPNKPRKTISSAEVVKQLGKGQYFGEVALITNSVRSAWVRADGYVLVAALAREDVQKIWVHFPKECDALVDMAAKTKKGDQERAERARSRIAQETMDELPYAQEETMNPVCTGKSSIFSIFEDSTEVVSASDTVERERLEVCHATLEKLASSGRQLEGSLERTAGDKLEQGDWRQSFVSKVSLRNAGRAEDAEMVREGMLCGPQTSANDTSAQAMRLKLGELTYCQGTLTQSQSNLQQQVAECLDRISSIEQALTVKHTYKSSKTPAAAMSSAAKSPGKSSALQGGAQSCWQPSPQPSYVPIPRFA